MHMRFPFLVVGMCKTTGSRSSAMLLRKKWDNEKQNLSPRQKQTIYHSYLKRSFNTTTIIVCACVLELSARMTLMASILLHNSLRATTQILMSFFFKPFDAKSMHIQQISNRKLYLIYLNSSLLSGCCWLESRSKSQDPDTFCWFSLLQYRICP